MDVDTTQAVEELGSRFDRLELSLHGQIAHLRAELKSEIVGLRTELRGEIGGLRKDLEQNWTRTQALFESVHGDIQMLAGHVANLASWNPPRTGR